MICTKVKNITGLKLRKENMNKVKEEVKKWMTKK